MAKNISDIDKNLKITTITENNIKFYSANERPFKVYGLMYDEKLGRFLRMPNDIAKNVNPGVEILNTNTSGGRIRFKTNSEYVAIKVISNTTGFMPHMALSGSSGFDLYTKDNNGYTYFATFMPSFSFDDFTNNHGYESIIHFSDRKMRDLTINFPLYNEVLNLYIGLEDNAALERGEPYKTEKPVVFYGSSITQGGCASRPGNAYANILSRKYDFDFINLGFSGSGMGEPAIAEYIAELDMSAFIYDYDYNAPNAEHLKKTHKPMFDTIRKAHPNIPIIIMSMPKLSLSESCIHRKEIIKETYDIAKSGGDKNVYFIPGDEIFKIFGNDSCTVDGCHPNDLGFMCMAEAVSEIFDTIFER